MPTTRAVYPPEFRERIVELARSGRTPKAVAKEFEPSAQSIRNSVCQTDLDEGRRSDGTRRQQSSRSSAAWLAREIGSVPDKSSSS